MTFNAKVATIACAVASALPVLAQVPPVPATKRFLGRSA